MKKQVKPLRKPLELKLFIVTYYRKIKSNILRLFRQKKDRSEEHTSELQSRGQLVSRLLLEKNKCKKRMYTTAKTWAGCSWGAQCAPTSPSPSPLSPYSPARLLLRTSFSFTSAERYSRLSYT